MRYRIVCIEKSPSHADPYHRITGVGLGQNKTDARWTVEQVINAILRGDSFYIAGSDGSTTDVLTRACPVQGHDHLVIATRRDNTMNDDLLSLPECK
jgi:hypothetical protein